MRLGEHNTLIDGMIRILAGNLVLGCKARLFAWSLGDKPIGDTKRLFCEDYGILDQLCDDLAVRIIAVGGEVSSTFSTLSQISSVKEDEKLGVTAMIERLATDHDQMIFDGQFMLALLESMPDKQTFDLLMRSIEQHGKCAKRLRGLLPDGAATLN